jgi:hypothetical protein
MRETEQQQLAQYRVLVRQLLALYRVLVEEVDLRSFCDDHDMAAETWRKIDELEKQVAGMS